LIAPPTSKDTIAAALAQNPYLTSLPSPSPDLLVPAALDYTTPTAALLRLPEVQNVIRSDFLLLPCDLICGIPGDTFLESYLTSLGGLGGVGTRLGSGVDANRKGVTAYGGERSGRRGGLSVWYNTKDREESVKGEECDFMCTTKLDAAYEAPLAKVNTEEDQGTIKKLLWAMPMSELKDQCEEEKSWKIRQSLMRKYGFVKCLTTYRDAHIYLFPYWAKEFAALNEDFESVSEDLVGTWAKAEWRKPRYRARFGARKIFGAKSKAKEEQDTNISKSIEEELDLLSLSSTQVTRHRPPTPPPQKRSAQLASRVRAEPEDSVLSPGNESDVDDSDSPVPEIPPMLSCILPSTATAPMVRRVDNTPLLLSVSLLLAKVPSIEDSKDSKQPISPFAHNQKVAATASIAQRVTITRNDTLIDNNTSIATQCVIKSSVIGSSVSIGTGSRITNCVIMDGATIGEKCVLTGTVVGKKAKLGSKCALNNCEVQDANVVAEGMEGKGEKYLIGGLEDEDEDMEDEDEDDQEGEALSQDED